MTLQTATVISIPAELLGTRATPPPGGPFDAEREIAEVLLRAEVEKFLDWWRRYTNRWIKADYETAAKEYADKEIRKVGSRWYVYSRTGKRIGGPYKTLAAARRRLRQIEYFAHKATGDFLDEPAYWTAAQAQFDADLMAEAQALMRQGALQAQALGLAINFDLVNDTVLSFSREYMDDWWRALATTSRNQMRTAISGWIQSGAPLSSLTKQLTPLFGKTRAGMIASTETTRLYADGNTIGYGAAGVTTVEWRTSRDERVCQVCLPLHGDTFAIGSNRPPAHVGCRCSIVPVTADGRALDKPTRSLGEQRPYDYRGSSSSQIAQGLRPQFVQYEKAIRDRLTSDQLRNIASVYGGHPSKLSHQVLSNAARAEMKRHVEKNLIARSGLSNADDYVRAWASSSTELEKSFAMQVAASEEFGIPLNQYLQSKLSNWTPFSSWKPTLEEARKVVRAMYDLTQEYLTQQGITSMRLFRGMGWGQNDLPGPIDELFGGQLSGRFSEVAELDFNPLSSWSIDIDTAQGFADGSYRVLAAIDVDASRIFCNPFTGAGCLNEYEFVVLGGPGQAFVTDTITAAQLLEGAARLLAVTS